MSWLVLSSRVIGVHQSTDNRSLRDIGVYSKGYFLEKGETVRIVPCNLTEE